MMFCLLLIYLSASWCQWSYCDYCSCYCYYSNAIIRMLLFSWCNAIEIRIILGISFSLLFLDERRRSAFSFFPVLNVDYSRIARHFESTHNRQRNIIGTKEMLYHKHTHTHIYSNAIWCLWCDAHVLVVPCIRFDSCQCVWVSVTMVESLKCHWAFVLFAFSPITLWLITNTIVGHW